MTNRGKARLNVFRLIAGMVTALVLLTITNPSETRHRKAIRRHVEMEAPYVFSEGDLKRGRFQYQNYFLFSTTRLSDEMGTFGVLGLVFTTDRLRPLLIELKISREADSR